MAQNVTIAGASYSDVPAVDLPKTGGGTATFMDTSDANATAGDIASGKTAYVNGEKITGTGGGGTETIIVPEQTVTASSSYTQITYSHAIVSGEEYQVTFNGTTSTKTATTYGSSIYISLATNLYIEFTGTTMYLDAAASSAYGTYTVKVWQESGGGGSTLIEKSITANGVYNASDDDADGYSKVTVNVSGGGGLVYETGTYTPASDVTSAFTISFQNTHTVPPFFYAITYCDSSAINTSRTAVGNYYVNSGQVFGGYSYGNSSNNVYGFQFQQYSANTAPSSGSPSTANGVLTTPSTDTSSSSASNSRYWATASNIKAYAGGRAFKSGKTYKWIAVWAPSS